MNIGIKTVLIALWQCVFSLFAAARRDIFARRTVVRFTDEIATAIDCCMRGRCRISSLQRILWQTRCGAVLLCCMKL